MVNYGQDHIFHGYLTGTGTVAPYLLWLIMVKTTPSMVTSLAPGRLHQSFVANYGQNHIFHGYLTGTGTVAPYLSWLIMVKTTSSVVTSLAMGRLHHIFRG